MKERPILFSGEMVRAILDGRKSQTRRIVKRRAKDEGEWLSIRPDRGYTPETIAAQFPCPYGSVGDRLWVRESFSFREYDPSIIEEMDPIFWYWADGNPAWGNFSWPKPSIHMPREACRAVLEVVAVRVERLQDITSADAWQEGVRPVGVAEHPGDGCDDRWENPEALTLDAFRDLWDGINKKSGHGWDANPWVWVIEFQRLDEQESAA